MTKIRRSDGSRGAPRAPEPAHREQAHPDQSSSQPQSADPLVEIDHLLNRRSSRVREMAEQSASARAEGEAFLRQFDEISRRVIKPTMEAVISRLRKDGGDGSIAERGLDASQNPRVILWMSLQGEISSEPHQDRNPFLQLDADTAHRRVDVWEGDMWEKQGASRAMAPWELVEISPESLTKRIIGILARATPHGLTH